MWELDKKAERWRIDAFKLWCWEDSWESFGQQGDQTNNIKGNQALEGLMLKVKLQYFGHLMPTADSLEKTLMLGRIEGRRRGGWQGWDGWMTSPIQCTWTWANLGDGERHGSLACCSPRSHYESDVIWRLNNSVMSNSLRVYQQTAKPSIMKA